MREFIITSYTVWLAKHEVGCFARLSSHVHDHEHEKHWKIRKKKVERKQTDCQKKRFLLLFNMYGRPATRSPRTPMIPTFRDVRDVKIRLKTYHRDHHRTYLRSCQFRRNQQGRQHLWGHAVADSKEHHRTPPYRQ